MVFVIVVNMMFVVVVVVVVVVVGCRGAVVSVFVVRIYNFGAYSGLGHCHGHCCIVMVVVLTC